MTLLHSRERLQSSRSFLRAHVDNDDDDATEERHNNGSINEDHEMHKNGSNFGDRERSSNGAILQCGSPNGALSFDPDSAASSEVDERERLRRERIGLANKGRTPWNKGKPHSPETIAIMKERNKIIMQDPKIREKLRQYSRPQSQETREKIRIFMKSRMEFERRQLTIVQEWKDSVASMARRGITGDDELEWDSYQVLKKELQREYHAAKKEKGKTHGTKSLELEHRLRISESVRAKWADPEYRNRVVQRIQMTRKKGSRIFKGKIMDKEFDVILNSVTGPLAGSPKSLASLDPKVGTYNDPLSEEKLKKIRRLRERNTTRKESELETELIGFHSADFKVTSSEEKKEKTMDVKARKPQFDGPMLGSPQVEDMAALQQAQREAAERARILLAEAERAAVLAVQALDAAGGHDECLSDSLLEAWTLLDEANKSISNTKVDKLSTN
ncbi:hypothetical protein GOP47_0018938 [Adiantum capillus-veneris]|uniref:Nuclease associated modular domain-containing protein n=1 Tax=Adiantum capillus-veneris TaxID=13818 RepID=A0A9D4UFD9_ADICA|nr:hypothetical protein GOP47_0018938 [Adiantum capillus-veneris]